MRFRTPWLLLPAFATSIVSACQSNAPDRQAQIASAIDEEESPGLVDFSTLEWKKIAAPYPMADHASITVDDGRVLVTGGTPVYDQVRESTNESYLFDPRAETWNRVDMLASRSGHVLFNAYSVTYAFGGTRRTTLESEILDTFEYFNPWDEAWSFVPQLLKGRRTRFTATPLNVEGGILLVGGYGDTGPIASVESAYPSRTVASLPEPRGDHTAAVLPMNTIVITGGYDGSYDVTATNYLLRSVTSSWEIGPPLQTARAFHTATTLFDGRVLIAGGQDDSLAPTASVEVLVGSFFDTSVQIADASPMLEARANHTAGRLPDGRVIVVGGWGANGKLNTTEIYDPSTDTWSAGPKLEVARSHHTMEVQSARVLVFGGTDASGQPLASAEVLEFGTKNGESCEYESECISGYCVDGVCCDTSCDGACEACSAALKGSGVDGVCEPVANGTNPRDLCSEGFVCEDSACVLPPNCPLCDDFNGANWQVVDAPLELVGSAAVDIDDARILVTGGYASPDAAYVFTPGTETWTALPPMNEEHSGHSATRLPTGRVIIYGGNGRTSEIFDPTAEEWVLLDDELEIWGRRHHGSVVDTEGRVILIGGVDEGLVSSVEIYDPNQGANGSWNQSFYLESERGYHTATLLPDGSIFVAGGASYENEGYLTGSTLRLLPPYEGDWSYGPWLSYPRREHTASLLPDGRVLLVGGTGYESAITSVEIIDPYWEPQGLISYTSAPPEEAASLRVARAQHTAATLPDGRIIVVGGSNYRGVTATTEIYDPVTGEWNYGPSLNFPRASHQMVVLPNRVVVLGGYDDQERWLDSVEVLDLGMGLGATCTADGECISGHCVDGVCCETACEGACVACTATLKGSGDDGVCGTVVNGTNPRSECTGDAVCQAGICASPAPCDGQPDGTSCGDGKVCQAGECVTPVAECSEDGTLCAEGDGCTVGICRDGACIDTYRLDGTRCEGGICIAGKCRLDPTPASDEEVGFDGGVGTEDPKTSNGGATGSSSGSDDAEDGGCSIGGRAQGSSPIATGLALLAAVGLMRRRGEKAHSSVDRG